MNRKLAPWLRLLAIWLTVTLAGDATGAFAAAMLAAPPTECCHGSDSPVACPVLSFTLGCCPARAASIQDDALRLNFSVTRERWPAVDHFGEIRRDKPPVPPPRG